ncbi:MAG: hypothetical protein IKR89_09570 [Bacteroidaceae bacterium]|nr:hypothetical protein [Bacteroidaceae bacterium]
MIESSRNKCKEIMRQLEAMEKLPTDAFAASQEKILSDLKKIIKSTSTTLTNTPSTSAFANRAEELENELNKLLQTKQAIKQNNLSEAIKILNDFAEGKADPMSYFTGMDDLFSFQDPDDF